MSGGNAHGHAKPKRSRNLIVGLIVAVFFVLGVILFNSAPKAPRHTSDATVATTASASAPAKPIHQATPELTLTANPNDGNDADDGDWATLKGKPGWTMCVGDLTGIEQQFKGKGSGWNSSMPPGGPTHWRFRSTTGKPETVEYNFDTSERCDTPVSLA